MLDSLWSAECTFSRDLNRIASVANDAVDNGEAAISDSPCGALVAGPACLCCESADAVTLFVGEGQAGEWIVKEAGASVRQAVLPLDTWRELVVGAG